jgi:hypothetical protein
MLRPLAFAVLLTVTASAQWITIRDSKAPRLADGRVNLAGPAPRSADGHPDLSGVWNRVDPRYLPNLAADGVVVPMQPWAAARYNERQANLGKDRPSGFCLPHGVPDAMAVPPPFKILQMPGLTMILFEEFANYRQVFTDGRAFPATFEPSWFGTSIGRWDGTTFVVDTRGFNDRSWLDDGGHPHTEALHTTERFTRKDYGHMTLRITIDDSKAYTKPWTVTMPYALVPDGELIEWICDNEKDAIHLK